MQTGEYCFWTSQEHLLHSVRTGKPAFPELYGTTAWEYWAAYPEENAVFNDQERTANDFGRLYAEVAFRLIDITAPDRRSPSSTMVSWSDLLRNTPALRSYRDYDSAKR